MSTFGGGLVAGDHIDLDASIDENATCVLATQASTKVYRSNDGARPANRSGFALGETPMRAASDPLTCFAGADFEQRIAVDLDSTASLVLVDWLTSGRRVRGERWAFRRYLSRIDVRIAGKLAFRDACVA